MRTHQFLKHLLVSSIALGAFTSGAQAFNPNAGAEDAARMAQPNYQQAPIDYQPLPTNIVPKRYYAPAATTAAPVAAATTYTAPAAATIAPLPEIHYQQPAAPIQVAQATYPTPMDGYVQAVPNPPRATYDQPARADHFSLGIEAYYDEYQEDSVSLTDKGKFAGLTANYTHYFDPRWYGALDARGAIGRTDYESLSGTVDEIPQWEIEARALVGYDEALGQGQHMKLYSGIGTRYFVDELKGAVTTLGASGYDRRILQVYLPIGVTYEFAAYGLQFAPNIEYDKLLYGYVNSRLQTLPGFYELDNTQSQGYGLRGELMMSALDAHGRGWQFGPFVRYWNIPDSKVDRNPLGTWLEPENTRLQAGGHIKYLF